MNLKYEVGQSVAIEAPKTVVEIQTSEIKSITVCSTGAKYLTSKGAFSEEQLDAFALKAQPIAPQEDKAKFKVGDRVIATDNIGHFVKQIATILDIDKSDPYTPFKVGFDERGLIMWCHSGDIEPYTEPEQSNSPDCAVDNLIYGRQAAEFFKAELQSRHKPEQPKEPIARLYCVKDYRPDEYITKGKIYEFDGHCVNYNGIKCFHANDFEDWKRGDSNAAQHLIPLVKRPAVVGEWVYIVKRLGFSKEKYEVGKIYKVVDVHALTKAITFEFGGAMAMPEEYEVLDNYHLEPEKVEPVYYSGKVVCVENDGVSVLTVGKVYTLINGETRYDDGVGLPLWQSKIKSIDDLNGRSEFKFIPYLGEA